jgi:hypothetical protein
VKAYLLAGGELILVLPQVLDALDALAQQLFRLSGSWRIIYNYLRLHRKFYDGPLPFKKIYSNQKILYRLSKDSPSKLFII